MESDSAFVAPEGVYSVTEEHRPPGAPAAVPPFPTRLSAISIRFANTKQPASPGFAQLLGANLTKDSKKERDKEKERPLLDERSSSSTETHDTSPEVSSQLPLPAQDSSTSPDATQLFAHPTASTGKKKVVSRPKHNMRTTSSTFITRVQTIEGLGKVLSNKQGEATFLFYNYAKAFFWVEAGFKSKVATIFCHSPVCNTSWSRSL